ncbi:MAG TPA: 16S rRNA (guanine(527)-N(7))-methyltransferase RsmG [Bryobacteraceae bacterium]|nr:16S rRNA (guanine(527)-N(7))-methyltransferase RsmG [Bryobacteraceae bacterium]
MPAPQWFSELLESQQVSGAQIAQLYVHYQVLERWNRKMNLTTVKSGPEMVRRHYCESLFFGAQFPGEPASITDVGSGAGFPGVPIAILRPACQVTLVESNQRKAVFLKEATRGIPNVSVLARRAEEVSGRFEWVVSRAVDPAEVVTLIPLLAPNIGLMVGEDDLLAIRKRSDIAWSEPIRLPWGDRRVCVYGRYVFGRST